MSLLEEGHRLARERYDMRGGVLSRPSILSALEAAQDFARFEYHSSASSSKVLFGALRLAAFWALRCALGSPPASSTALASARRFLASFRGT